MPFCMLTDADAKAVGSLSGIQPDPHYLALGRIALKTNKKKIPQQNKKKPHLETLSPPR